ncbi:hypothetical protein ACHMW6_06445 [Pseudoduganella sp. UC29_106]|uniref:phage tail assembly protein T n=1 Tax=Pseudoduganella sp. UC29_106 TaxID=3374553 RepID=UPI00375805FC
MSSAEFSLWVEAYKDDQWGEQSAYWRAGMVASTVANFAGKQLAANGNTKPQDFMPNFGDEETEPQEPDPVAFFTAIANATEFKQG